MGVQYLIFFYMAISILMAVFDFGFLLYERLRDRHFERQTSRIAAELGQEIERNAAFPTEEHRLSIRKKMRRLSGLESFDLTMDKLKEAEPEKSVRYLGGIVDVFEYLARYFDSKSDLHKAYFAYIVRKWYRADPPSRAMLSTLLGYVNEGSLYLRQNALEALAKVGTPQALTEALIDVEANVEFHHPKLITEITMAFEGSDAELADELDRRFQEFRPDMQAAIINFMRMKGQGDPELYLRLLQDEDADTEVRLASMRYFMRHKDRRVVPILRDLALSKDAGHWEYAAVAATVLGAYPDEGTFETLLTCLSSPQWYVRYNAAKSLHGAGLTLDSPYLAPVLEGDDRYAKEMVRYRWEVEDAAQADNEVPHAVVIEAPESEDASGEGEDRGTVVPWTVDAVTGEAPSSRPVQKGA